MPRVSFASSIQRHVAVPDLEVPGATVRDVLDAVFAQHESLRGYVLDDQAGLRDHVVVFVDGAQVGDRRQLGDPVPANARVHVIQALSGG
ncbi:MAG: MoaD/ThiS family protein [Planctomycetota bacterium]